mmetsp:Transcript_10732/g.48382  ORF Transcript_10732/g.48382 Transcript_10732/m.48382 type:complete len:265 (+) Transcript_10732:4153-4947(+)
MFARTTSIASGPREISSDVDAGGGNPSCIFRRTSSRVRTRVFPLLASMPAALSRSTARFLAALSFSFFSFSSRAAISSGDSPGSGLGGFSASSLAIRSIRADLRRCSTMSSKHSCVFCCRSLTSSMWRSSASVSGESYQPRRSSMSEPYTLVSLSGLSPTLETRAACFDARSSLVRDSYIPLASSFGVLSSCLTSIASGPFCSRYLKKLPNVAPAAAAACSGVPTFSCTAVTCAGVMRSMTRLANLVISGNVPWSRFAHPSAIR